MPQNLTAETLDGLAPFHLANLPGMKNFTSAEALVREAKRRVALPDHAEAPALSKRMEVALLRFVRTHGPLVTSSSRYSDLREGRRVHIEAAAANLEAGSATDALRLMLLAIVLEEAQQIGKGGAK